MRLRIEPASAREPQLFLRRNRHLDLPYDGTCHFTLQREYIAELALVAAVPEMAICRGVDELRRDPYTLARLLHGALEDRIHVQFPRDLAGVISCCPCSA